MPEEDDMQLSARRTGCGFPLLAVCALFCAGGGRASAAAKIDCDGRLVRDTTYIDSALAAQLDTASSEMYLMFALVLWNPDWVLLPDSCYRTRDTRCYVPNPNPALDSVVYADWMDWYDWVDRWMPKLFDEYPLYVYGDTVHRQSATSASRDNTASHLFAKKSTIIRLSRECPIMQLTLPPPFSPVTLNSSRVISHSSQGKFRFNALGRKLPRQEGAPRPLGIPWRPGLTPSFER